MEDCKHERIHFNSLKELGKFLIQADDSFNLIQIEDDSPDPKLIGNKVVQEFYKMSIIITPK